MKASLIYITWEVYGGDNIISWRADSTLLVAGGEDSLAALDLSGIYVMYHDGTAYDSI
jgi:hypothetical protein